MNNPVQNGINGIVFQYGTQQEAEEAVVQLTERLRNAEQTIADNARVKQDEIAQAVQQAQAQDLVNLQQAVQQEQAQGALNLRQAVTQKHTQAVALLQRAVAREQAQGVVNLRQAVQQAQAQGVLNLQQAVQQERELAEIRLEGEQRRGAGNLQRAVEREQMRGELHLQREQQRGALNLQQGVVRLQEEQRREYPGFSRTVSAAAGIAGGAAAAYLMYNNPDMLLDYLAELDYNVVLGTVMPYATELATVAAGIAGYAVSSVVGTAALFGIMKLVQAIDYVGKSIIKAALITLPLQLLNLTFKTVIGIIRLPYTIPRFAYHVLIGALTRLRDLPGLIYEYRVTAFLLAAAALYAYTCPDHAMILVQYAYENVRPYVPSVVANTMKQSYAFGESMVPVVVNAAQAGYAYAQPIVSNALVQGYAYAGSGLSAAGTMGYNAASAAGTMGYNAASAAGTMGYNVASAAGTMGYNVASTVYTNAGPVLSILGKKGYNAASAVYAYCEPTVSSVLNQGSAFFKQYV